MEEKTKEDANLRRGNVNFENQGDDDTMDPELVEQLRQLKMELKVCDMKVGMHANCRSDIRVMHFLYLACLALLQR